MKKIILLIALTSISLCSLAQDKPPVFPFKGGIEHMMAFFKDSVIVSQDMIQKKASGIVILKFSADPLGRISRVVLYYADDASLTQPAIDGLKRSNGKWDIPVGQKSGQYLITFYFNFTPPAAPSPDLVNSVYDYNVNRRPIVASNELPLDNGTLLPTITVNYDIPQ